MKPSWQVTSVSIRRHEYVFICRLNLIYCLEHILHFYFKTSTSLRFLRNCSELQSSNTLVRLCMILQWWITMYEWMDECTIEWILWWITYITPERIYCQTKDKILERLLEHENINYWWDVVSWNRRLIW